MAFAAAIEAKPRAGKLEARPIAGPPAAEIVGAIGKRAVFVEGVEQRRGNFVNPRPNLRITKRSGRRSKRLLELEAPGAEILSPYEEAPVQGRVIFLADDGVHGFEWWSTDGTRAGTQMLVDGMPGPDSGVDRADQPVSLEGGVTILPIADPAHGREWWRTDGTPEGTQLIEDINPGPQGSHGPSTSVDRTIAGGLMFFTAAVAQQESWSYELWRSDGTAAGTFSLQLEMGGGGLRGGALGSELIFGDGHNGLSPELWRSDGTPEGTEPYFGFPGEPQASPAPLAFGPTEGHLFLNRTNVLWVIDSTASPPSRLREFQGLGVGGPASPSNRAAFGLPVGPALVFDAFTGPPPPDPDAFRSEPWVSLGTPETTVPLASIVPGASLAAVSSTGEQALISREHRGRAVLHSTRGSRESVKKIRIGRRLEQLGIADPTEAKRGVYFAGRAERRNGHGHSFSLWKIGTRR